MEELENLLPHELEILIERAKELLNQKDDSILTHHEFIEKELKTEKCPFCGSTYFVKNGHHNGIQRFKCKECNKTFGSTNGTFLYHTQQSYKTWITFIKCELLGMTLKAEADELELTQPTCFAMRHKLHNAISEKRTSVKLKGNIQSDFLYRSINLKGTLPRQNA